MNVKVLRDFRDIFVGNPDCFSPEEIPCELKTLLKQPILMLSSKSTTSEYLHQMFATHGLNLLPEVELNSNDLLMDLARIGLGIACIPDYMLNPDDSLKPIPLADPLPPDSLSSFSMTVFHFPRLLNDFLICSHNVKKSRQSGNL